MKIGRWSTTAASNNNTPPDGWPEGQAPSTVNDCAREMMASIRTMINDLSFIDLAHTPTQTGSTTFTLPGNVVSFYDIGRRVKAFDASTLYGTIISSSFTTNTGITLRMDSGVLTTSLTSVAVSVLGNNNHALPNAAFINHNVIVDGLIDYIERPVGSGALNVSGSAAQVVITDPIHYLQNATASVNITVINRSASASNVPSLAQAGILINNAIQISVSAADAAIAASDYAAVVVWVEGQEWLDIAHKPNAVSLWVQSNRTGTYCMAMMNPTGSQTFIQNYTISSTSWEKKTFQIPEAPTTGTWGYGAGTVGVQMVFALAAGTSFQASAGTWTSTIAFATSSQTNFLASAGHTMRMTGFKLEEGYGNTPLARESTERTVARHRRYFEIGIDYNEGYGLADNNISNTIRYTYPKRVNPSVGVSDPAASSGFTAGPQVTSIGTNEFRQFFKKNGITGYFFWGNNWSADAAPTLTI